MKRSEMKAHAKVIVDKLFDIPALKENVESNVNNSVDRYDAEDGRLTVYLLTLMGGNWGVKIYPVLFEETFELGKSEGDNDEDISGLYDELDYFAGLVAEELDSRYPELEGNFHFGSHEADGSYCLFYSWDIGEEGEEEPACLYEEVRDIISSYEQGDADAYDMYAVLVKVKEQWDNEKEVERQEVEEEHRMIQNAEAENYRIANNMKEDGEI